MPPDPPPPSPGRPSRHGSRGNKTLVGGLPWQNLPPTETTPPGVPSSPAATSAAPGGTAILTDAVPSFDIPAADPPADESAFDFTAPRAAARPPSRAPRTATGSTGLPRSRGWLVGVLGEEEAAEFGSISARIGARLEAWVRESPPFTVSLCVHVVVLLALALVFVRIERQRRRPIDLSFASSTPVAAEKPGVQIVEPQPEPEPEPEVMKQEKPVEDPMAAPRAAEAEKVEALGAEPAPAAAPAVGSLLDGREVGQRARLVAAYGGSDATEAAVGRALDWLARQQGKDGLWSLQGPYADGGSQENRLAATAMALLAFQGAGNTPQAGLHRRAVAAAWTALLKKQVVGGDREGVAERRKSGAGRFEIALNDPPERQALYSHAQATIALCELYGMTREPGYEQPARRAVAFAVAAQGNNGGWRYEPGQNGDMSVTGWFMMALKSAQMAGLEVPAEAFNGLGRFLDGVAVGDGSRYGYRFDEMSRAATATDRKLVRATAGPVTDAVSAEGLLCRQYLGWPRAHPALTAGVDVLLQGKLLDWDGNSSFIRPFHRPHAGPPR